MRRRKYFFDFKIEISVKCRVEWCVRLCDSYWICQCSLYFVHIHAYANSNCWGNMDKFNMNKTVLHITWRGIWRLFRFWSQKNISAYAFKGKLRLKKFAWADPKNFHWFESGVKLWYGSLRLVDRYGIVNRYGFQNWLNSRYKNSFFRRFRNFSQFRNCDLLENQIALCCDCELRSKNELC